MKLSINTIGILLLASMPAVGSPTAPPVSGTILLTGTSFTVYEPVFVAVRETNATAQGVRVAMGARRLVLERQGAGGTWTRVDLFDGIQVPSQCPYAPRDDWKTVPAGGTAWSEHLLRSSSFYSVAGTYHIQLQTTVIDATGTATSQSSPWVTFTLVSDPATVAVINSAGVLPAYQALFAGDYSHGEIRLPSFDQAALAPVMSGAVSPGVSQFVDMLRAQDLIRVAGLQSTPAAATQKLNNALSLLGAINLTRYTGGVGGVGADTKYSIAWAHWFLAATQAQCDAATAEYLAIPQTYPGSLLAVDRQNWSQLRDLLP